MRSGTWMVTLATAGLLTAGAAVPANAAESTAPTAAPAAERAVAGGQGGTPDMGRMHELMMKGMDMASMAEIMQDAPGLAQMCEKMMSDTAPDRTASI